VVGVDPAVRMRQHRRQFFWYHESDDIYSHRFVEAKDLEVIQPSIRCQLPLEDFFDRLKHFRPLLQ
jgi:hypothetical protein